MKAEQDSTIFSLLMFRPYGSSLMTPGARLWLTTTWVMALFIASVEAWVVATLLQQLNASTWIAVCAALAVFAAMFLIDASFVLLDTSATAPTFAGRRTSWGQHLRLFLAVGVRAALFLTTLLVTIPVASLALLDDELKAEQDLSYEQRVAEAQVAQEQRLQAEVTAVEQRLDGMRQRWTDEVNAADVDGVSGKQGVGARARKYERDQRLLEREVRRAQQRLDAYREHMSGLSPEQRGLELGVPRPELTFASRAATLDQIADRPGVSQKTLLVKVYLLIAFGAVVLLKLLSPTAVRTYLSEELQEARRRAQRRGYDGLLRYGPEGVIPAELGPIDFRHWYFHVLPELRQRREAISQVYESRASLEAHRGALEYAVAATRTVVEREESAREDLALAQVDVYHIEDEIADQERLAGARFRARAAASRQGERQEGQEGQEGGGSRPRGRSADAVLAGKLVVAEQRLQARQADLDRIQHRRAIAERREEVLLDRVNEREESHLQQVTEAAKGLGAHATFDPALLLPATLGLSADELSGREVKALQARSVPLLDAGVEVPSHAAAQGAHPAEQGQGVHGNYEHDDDDEPVTLVLSREDADRILTQPATTPRVSDVAAPQPDAAQKAEEHQAPHQGLQQARSNDAAGITERGRVQEPVQAQPDEVVHKVEEHQVPSDDAALAADAQPTQSDAAAEQAGDKARQAQSGDAAEKAGEQAQQTQSDDAAEKAREQPAQVQPTAAAAQPPETDIHERVTRVPEATAAAAGAGSPAGSRRVSAASDHVPSQKAKAADESEPTIEIDQDELFPVDNGERDPAREHASRPGEEEEEITRPFRLPGRAPGSTAPSAESRPVPGTSEDGEAAQGTSHHVQQNEREEPRTRVRRRPTAAGITRSGRAVGAAGVAGEDREPSV